MAVNLNMIMFNHPTAEFSAVIEQLLQYLSSNYNLKDFDIKYNKAREDSLKNSTNNVAEQVVEAIKDSVEVNRVNTDDILDAESLVYKYKDGMHYFILLADDSKFDADYLKEKITEFNKEKFEDLSLSVSANLFTSTYQILNVKKFSNRDEAFAYYDSIRNDSLFTVMNSSYYKCFIISMQNYATFYSKRNIDAYMKFFRIMYLENREEENK